MITRTTSELLSYHLHLPIDTEGRPAGLPLVLDSPHSGTTYPPDFRPAIDPAPLRTAEDTWVADLWSHAPARGVALLEARFPRSYIDANRAAEEIDPALLAEPWPEPLPDSPKVKLGKGLIWRMMDDGTPLYDRLLSLEEVQHRIQACWQPYHAALARVLDETYARHGHVWHLNCHSMPSIPGIYATDTPDLPHPDFVLGDLDGATADASLREFVAHHLRGLGYDVSLNAPYKGVELVRRFGRPAQHRHSLQIEINRRLYMDEVTLRPHEGYERLQAHLDGLLDALLDWIAPQRPVE